MFETHSLFDAEPVFDQPDNREAAALLEDGPEEQQYNQFEHEDWMSDLRSLAAQSMAVNTNHGRLDSTPAVGARENGALMIQAPSELPAAGPLEAPALTPAAPVVAPAVSQPSASRPSRARMLGLLAVAATLAVVAVLAMQAGLSRRMVLRNHALGRMVAGAAVAGAPQEARDQGRAGHARRELSSPERTTAMAAPLGGSMSGPATPRPRSAEGNGSSDPAEAPGTTAEDPAATTPVSPPPASPQSLAEAIQRAAGAKPAPAAPAAPAATPEAAPPPERDSFNRAAAQGALRGIAGSLSRCKSDSRGSGRGGIRVTFAPSGNATNAVVEGGPFAGTPTGSCVARLFRGARVPPFSGGPVTVRQGFIIR